MSTVAILNVVLAVLVVAAILSLLGWGILTDARVVVPRMGRNRQIARRRTARAAGEHRGQMQDSLA